MILKNIIDSLDLFPKNLKLNSLSTKEVHDVLAKIIMKNLEKDWRESKKAHNSKKRAYYFSAEFLIGRIILNNLNCLGVFEGLDEYLSGKNFNLNSLEEIEDAALGNGGLGRLAACFLGSAATLNLPLDGYGIKYKFGYFKQKIEKGFQKEYSDNWTDENDCWFERCPYDLVEVKFNDCLVKAVPYDIPIVGFKTNHISTLRLWQAKAKNEFDFETFDNFEIEKAFKQKILAEQISSVLYPNDSKEEGKILRLKQQYFFCSASLQDIIKKFKTKNNSDFSKFSNYVTIQLNDTHPVISIAELIRLLCEQEGLNFKDAFKITKESFNYTNHTVMAEALEKWPKNLIEKVIPHVLKYIELIQEEFNLKMKSLNISKEKSRTMAPIENNTVNMANLAVFSSKFTNGVSGIHTNILKNKVLSDWFKIYPQKFKSITNGIDQRRWIYSCNKELSSLISKLLGNNDWILNLTKLKELEKFSSNEEVLEEFAKIKLKKHKQLVEYIKKQEGILIDGNSIFDVQIKRIHEYKRQFLNILTILDIYFKIKNNEIKNFNKTTFIFGGKAAPSYFRAKAIIKLINSVAKLINTDKMVNELIKVVFIQNYNVSYAEKIIPAANVSQQISTAGTEASGTSNMKFMLNGAVTIGTFDGANIEIVEQAGKENNYIFGKICEQIEELSKNYNPTEIFENNESIKRALNSLTNGLLDDGNSGMFEELKNSILKGASYHKPDQYFLLADFESYLKTRLKLNEDFGDHFEFNKKCLLNIANAGIFSSDNAIQNYAKNIWDINKI